MYKREADYSESKDFIVRTSKGLTAYISLKTKSSNNKQKERFYITDTTKQDFRKFLNNSNNSPYLGYNSKQVHNEPTEACLFLINDLRSC